MSCFERIRPVDSVLILDDDLDDLEQMRVACGPRETYATASVNEALQIASSQHLDLAIIDLWLGPQDGAEGLSRRYKRDASGLDVIRALREDHRALIITLYSRSVSRSHRDAALAVGANGAVPKLSGGEKLLMIVESGHLETYPLWPSSEPPTLDWKIHDYAFERYVANKCNATVTRKELGISASKLYSLLRESVPARPVDGLSRLRLAATSAAPRR